MTEIRPLKSEEIPLLEEFLYQDIFIPQIKTRITKEYCKNSRKISKRL